MLSYDLPSKFRVKKTVEERPEDVDSWKASCASERQATEKRVVNP